MSTSLPPSIASRLSLESPNTLVAHQALANGQSDDDRPPEAGLVMQRYWTRAGVHPYDEILWEKRTALIAGDDGRPIFEQRDVDFPQAWSQLATNVVASKYFRGPLHAPQRETSVRQLLDRVVQTITTWGQQGGYFAAEEDATIFAQELTHLLLHQRAAFNSPVWFNVGVEERPQASACFIIAVEDSMESILEWYRQEGVIFKGGSGAGVNLSKIRGSHEPLSSGGVASGPLSFMRAADASAGAIKSGGKTRRAAKMVILNIDHPDVQAFIQCKADEERKAWALIDAGYDASLDGAAYASVFFQNANNSVRVPDAFMQAVEQNLDWHLRTVTTGEVCATIPARQLLRLIAEATHLCGDPGMQFDTTMNAWHTVPNSGRINATNPCSEFCFLDNTACNLSSLNLLQFVDADGEFDVPAFRHAVAIMIIAQEILVSNAVYPTPGITRRSEDFRPLGLGYANLGALLMARGLPYDSDAGRAYAAAVTALMTGQAYLTSANIAHVTGPFAGYAENREPFLHVMRKHRNSLQQVEHAVVPHDLMQAAVAAWDEALDVGTRYGYRNAQATLLAPTGTISFMMDCDTTGVEPDIALIKYKKLVGGGTMKIINATVPLALKRLGYPLHQRQDIVQYIDAHEMIEGAPGLREAHLPVFDCAFRPAHGTRSIAWEGHVRMMAAVQPFLSGSISKTVNMPPDATVEDIEHAYLLGWHLGVKSLAVYRDGCKRTQPLNTRATAEIATPVAKPIRRRLPDERPAITHKFSIGGHDGYVTVGMFEDGSPGEIFLVMAKEGSTISGLVDAFATSISLALQYGVPLKALIDKFSHMRFEPSGFTNNKEIPIAKSVMDYLFRWLASKFLDHEDRARVGVLDISEDGVMQPFLPGMVAPGAVPYGNGNTPTAEEERFPFRMQEDAPSCAECGALMIRNGACYKCFNCGASSGCS